MVKKDHHFVPIAYLKHFCDKDEFVYIIRKENPQKAFRQKPESFAFHKYYYAQSLPDGGRDTDTLENLFSSLEAKWPPIINRLSRKENVNGELETIFQFVALQRARVPAMRDAIEILEAARIKSLVKAMATKGKLPPLPEGFPNPLDHLTVSIDPHRSILAMPKLMEAMGHVIDRVGFGILHNTTDIPFLASDNPVIFFDPTTPSEVMRPYTLNPLGGEVVMMMPLAKSMMLYGHSANKQSFAKYGLTHGEITDEEMVFMMNEQICRFAYDAVYASQAGFEFLVQKFAAKSPIAQLSQVKVNGQIHEVAHFDFGSRTTKTKWNANSDPAQ